MSNGQSRTLRAIRKGAPEGDRQDPALRSNNRPRWATANDGSRYVAVSLYPRTVDELRQHCREFGEAAVADVRWSAVVHWLMNGPPGTDLRNPVPVASVAVLMVRERDRIRLGWPSHDGKPLPPASIESLSQDTRQEAELAAAETLSNWETAGRPNMGRERITQAFRYLIGCPAFQYRYVSAASEAATKETE